MRTSSGRRLLSYVRSGSLLIIAATFLLSLSQSACLFKKSKPKKVTPPSEARIAILPFNVPAGNQDLRWTAMAGPILMEKVVERSRDLKVTPLWESMPTAIESSGVTRTFTQETSTAAATWLSVDWAAIGEFSTTKTGLRMMVDFMPAKTGSVPFRFAKSGKIDELGARLPEAISQFSYYLAIRPLMPAQKKLPTMTSVRKWAEAVDREYGWFVDAEPGKAQAIVTELANTDMKLARFLFNPSLYPGLNAK
ncbi:MAG TPA: hypothetical protein VMG30_09130 [Acidobacteriota bacterium]|nr:hypothetical protein [Acidobacteriota bacterium]